jgi:cell division protein FtsI (penicillin-binding protein 3)
MLREVVEEQGGTGKQARIPGLVVGGKTGTAQKADAKGGYGKGRVGSFVGMIPIENPRYLICVLLDEPTSVQYGGVIAAPVFRHVALHTMAYHGLLPESDDPVVKAAALKVKKIKGGQAATSAPQPGSPAGDGGAVRSARGRHLVPPVVGLGIRSAVEVFAGQGIMPVLKGRGSFVVRQTPEAGLPWPDGKKECTLWLEERSS